MRVEQLIKILKKYPKDTEVMIVDENCDDDTQSGYVITPNKIDLLEAKEIDTQKDCFVVALTFSNRFDNQSPY